MGFYCQIKDFSKTTKSLTLALAKDTPFVFSKECLEAFHRIKEALIMCNANDYAIGAVFRR